MTSDDIIPESFPEEFADGPPARRAADIGAGLAKAAVSAVPGVGGAAAELFALVIGPALEERKDEWMRRLGEAVDELQARLEGFDPRDLAGNEQFVTAVLNASTAAVRTHQAEKLDMLRNAIVNVVMPGGPDEHEQLLFIRYVDELTPLHVRLLAFLADPAGWYDERGMAKERFLMGSVARILEPAFPELAGRADVYVPAVADLDARRLTDAGAAMTAGMSNDGVWASRITAAGRRFLAFVSDPPQP